jgi:hypothetical protein
MKVKRLKLTGEYTIEFGANGSCWTAKMAVWGPIGAVGTKMSFLNFLNPLL